MEDKKIGFYGGSFNPPHVGHIFSAVYSITQHNLDKVIVVPCGKHPFSKNLIPAIHRYSMCCQCFMHLSDKVEVSFLECWESNTNDKESYTIDTLKIYQEKYPKAKLRLIIGEDNLQGLKQWKNIDEINEIASPFIILPRGSFQVNKDDDRLEMLVHKNLMPDISSTDIRTTITSDLPSRCKEKILEKYLHPEVLKYIYKHKLYIQ